jgi:DNA-binding NtrC family response regulator
VHFGRAATWAGGDQAASSSSSGRPRVVLLIGLPLPIQAADRLRAPPVFTARGRPEHWRFMPANFWRRTLAAGADIGTRHAVVCSMRNGELGARPRVLVIDDEESMRHALAKGLERAGFRTTTAATGRGGVELFVAGGFDAVLTDVRLPDLSGLDITAILVEMDASVPVVVMTGYGTMEVALEAMRRGAKDYVQKPFRVEDVARILARAVQESRLSRENRRLRALVERRLSPEGFEEVEAELAALRGTGAGQGASETSAQGGVPLSLREAQRRFEIQYVEELLAQTAGNVAAAARLAGISRPNFHKKLKTLGIEAQRFKEAARRGRLRSL